MTDLGNLSENVAAEIKSAEENIEADAATKMNRDALKVEEKRINAEVQMNDRQAERDEHIAEMQFGVQEYRNMFQEMFDKLSSLVNPPTIPETPSGDVIVTTPIAPTSEDTIPPPIPPENKEVETPEQIPEEIGEDLEKETQEVGEQINGPTRKRGRRNRKSR